MSQPQFRPFEGPRVYRERREEREAREKTCVSFTERVFPWGHAADFWITYDPGF